MLKMIGNLLLRLVVAALISININPIPAPLKPPTTSYNQPTILIHDVSPYYLKYLKQITQILDQANYGPHVYLFVIVNHGGKANILKNWQFIAFLHKLQSRGYHIELHGLNHIGRKYNTDYKTAITDLKHALSTMFIAGFTPRFIFPPRNAVSSDALKAMHRLHLGVLTATAFYSSDRSQIPIMCKEYTWYLKDQQALKSASEKFRRDIKQARQNHIPFYLSIHPKAVNTPFGMEFLRAIIEENQPPR